MSEALAASEADLPRHIFPVFGTCRRRIGPASVQVEDFHPCIGILPQQIPRPCLGIFRSIKAFGCLSGNAQFVGHIVATPVGRVGCLMLNRGCMTCHVLALREVA